MYNRTKIHTDVI